MKQPTLEKAFIVSDIDGKFHLYFLRSAAERHFKKEQEKYSNTKNQLIFWLEDQKA